MVSHGEPLSNRKSNNDTKTNTTSDAGHPSHFDSRELRFCALESKMKSFASDFEAQRLLLSQQMGTLHTTCDRIMFDSAHRDQQHSQEINTLI